MNDEIIDFNYENLNDNLGIIEYCQKSDINLKKIKHSKIKNYVMNSLYSAEEITETEKYIFTFLYDFKAQQKYLPGIYVNQSKLAFVLGLSESSISRAINSLVELNLLIKETDKFGDNYIIPNENINNWGVGINKHRLDYLEELRKHTASSNVLINEQYKSYIKENETLK